MTQMDLFQTATSSQPDTRANHLVSPGSEEAKKMTATSGLKYSALLKQKDPLGAFSRMFMVTLPWASTKCLLTWKPKATPAGRLLFQLAVSMPRTEETDSGLWATPRTTDGTGGPNKLDEKGRRISQTNPDLVFGAKLADQVKMWPTPNASDRFNANMKDGHDIKRGYLRGVVAMLPTPTASDWKNMHTANQTMLGNHPDVANTRAGTLNPTWVEWLMGYPEGWTDLKD